MTFYDCRTNGIKTKAKVVFAVIKTNTLIIPEIVGGLFAEIYFIQTRLKAKYKETIANCVKHAFVQINSESNTTKQNKNHVQSMYFSLVFTVYCNNCINQLCEINTRR